MQQQLIQHKNLYLSAPREIRNTVVKSQFSTCINICDGKEANSCPSVYTTTKGHRFTVSIWVCCIINHSPSPIRFCGVNTVKYKTK